MKIMEKLELKDIASYLPYGVEFILSDKGIFNLDSEYGTPYQAYKPMKIINMVFGRNECEIEIHSDETNWGVGFIELDEVLPILRPLYDLTKEIDVNGEKFIPIVKLADLYIKPRKHKLIGTIASNDYGDLWFEKTSKRFLSCENQSDARTESPLHIFEMYQKLFEWHFDLFDLIQNKLAIDINKL